jgi:transposase
MTSPTYLGLDIAKRKFDAALLCDGRNRHKQFPNTPAGFTQLQPWLRQYALSPVHAALEATGTYGDALALFLHQTGVRVSVINPARIKAFAQSELARNKTDAVDAALIARFTAAHQPRAWTPPPPAQGRLLDLDLARQSRFPPSRFHPAIVPHTLSPNRPPRAMPPPAGCRYCRQRGWTLRCR